MKKEAQTLGCLSRFYKAFGLPSNKTPTMIDKNQSDLRVELLQEELNELKKAIEEKDIVEVADALADIQYVLTGTILEFGLGNHFKEIFEKVHQSNMGKMARTAKEAKLTVANYKSTKNIEAYFTKLGRGRYIVYRKSDNKILKPITYKPVNLKFIVD